MFQFCKVTFRLLPFCLLPAILLFVSSCSKSEDPILKINETTFDPVSDPEAVNRLLQVQGSYAENTPLPAKSPKIDTTLGEYETSKPFFFNPTGIDTIEIGNETNSYIPIRYIENNFCSYFKFTNIYLKVQGAKGRWKIPITEDPLGTSNLIPSCFAGLTFLAVPALVKEGDFRLTLCAEIQCYKPECNQLGGSNIKLVTDTINVILSVRKPIPCGSEIEGRAGLTIRKIDFGANASAGKVKIRFKSYGIPDRMDISLGGQYVESTCDVIPNSSSYPSCKPDWCFKTSGVNGEGWLDYEFDYDPAKGRYAELFVRGSCDDSRTKWRINVSCPE